MASRRQQNARRLGIFLVAAGLSLWVAQLVVAAQR